MRFDDYRPFFNSTSRIGREIVPILMKAIGVSDQVRLKVCHVWKPNDVLTIIYKLAAIEEPVCQGMVKVNFYSSSISIIGAWINAPMEV